MSAPDAVGWFASQGDEEDYGFDERWPWRPYLQERGGCLPLSDVWFFTEQECEDFIRKEILNVGMLHPRDNKVMEQHN